MNDNITAPGLPADRSLNHEVAEKLREISFLLQKQNANPFRFRAYLNAASTLDNLKTDIKDIVEKQGIEGLVALPAIGSGIARSIYEYVAMGRMTRLMNLKGESDPVSLFKSIPGVGPELARRIYAQTHADSLEALEMAIRNGVLQTIAGLGEKRLKGIHAWLIKSLGEQKTRPNFKPAADHVPSIELLLKVDSEFREKAKSGQLPKIAPKRFNPEGKAWLPILHTTRQGWHFTVVFSNTSLAHELKRTDDWVVLYFYDEHHQEGQHTVVTETRGPLIGQRVVRGREPECGEFYMPVKAVEGQKNVRS
ncbi:MAG: helix-hairpin-helix domain-containing protein [Gammaproteobacteria bacterium]|nr:helix-hairpin-helix domain-containing protein [Gammaproteobacteria bacterium]